MRIHFSTIPVCDNKSIAMHIGTHHDYPKLKIIYQLCELNKNNLFSDKIRGYEEIWFIGDHFCFSSFEQYMKGKKDEFGGPNTFSYLNTRLDHSLPVQILHKDIMLSVD